jgi:paired amphipathic helix protein Sin3a
VFKNLGLKLAQAPPPKFNSIANGLGLTNEDQRFQDAAHFYDFLLESCEKLFDNEIDVPLFEDQLRYMFGPKVTVALELLSCLC